MSKIYMMQLPDGTYIRSGNAQATSIADVTLTRSINNGTDLTLGSVCAAMAEITLLLQDDGVTIAQGDEISLTLSDTETMIAEEMGLFTVSTVKKIGRNKLKLTAYDRISWLDKPFTGMVALSQITAFSLLEDRTIIQLASLICKYCGLTLGNTDSAKNSGFVVNNVKSAIYGATCRQIMQWIGEITGCFVTADTTGNVVFGWYAEADPLKITITPGGDTNYYFADSLSFEDYDVQAVDAVKLQIAGDASEMIYPDTESANPYVITGNKILAVNAPDKGSSENNTEYVLGELLGAFAFTYRPCTVAVSVLDCDAQAGQIITVTDINGVRFETLVMQTVQKGFKRTLESTGNTSRVSSESYAESVVSGGSTAKILPIIEGGTAATTAKDARKNLGAAPAGYGLGEDLSYVYTSDGWVGTEPVDADSLTLPGWYLVENVQISSTQGLANVVVHVDDASTQTTFYTDAQYNAHYKLTRCKINGVWQPWEWENPPMLPDEEYRTTERWNGKAVYTKLIDIGALPNTATKNIAMGVSAKNIVRAENETYGDDGIMRQSPYLLSDGTLAIKHVFNGTTLQIITKSDYSSSNGYFRIWYIKD